MQFTRFHKPREMNVNSHHLTMTVSHAVRDVRTLSGSFLKVDFIDINLQHQSHSAVTLR